MQTILEIFICGYDTRSRICFSKHWADITSNCEDPDLALGVTLSNLGFKAPPDEVCVHSTSWRYETQKIVLTYLVWTDVQYIDKANAGALDFKDKKKEPESKSSLSPRPECLEQEDVLRHGLRHLSFLVHQGNPFIIQAAQKTRSIHFFKSVAPSLSGRINRSA